MKELIEKIEAYGFSCQAGDLQHCKEWQELRERIISITAYCEMLQLIDDGATQPKSKWQDRLDQMKKAQEERLRKANEG